MDYSFSDFINQNRLNNFFELTKWVVERYLLRQIDLDKTYKQTDLKKWQKEIEKMITPEFVEENGLRELTDYYIDHIGFSYSLYLLAKGIAEGEFTLNDFDPIGSNLLAFMLRVEIEDVFCFFWDYIRLEGEEDNIPANNIINALSRFKTGF